MGLDDLGQAPIILAEPRRLGEELRRVAHGAYRVANFVGDARAEASQRREFRLLHARVDMADVFEEHENRPIALSVAAERGEVRRDTHIVALRDQCELRV